MPAIIRRICVRACEMHAPPHSRSVVSVTCLLTYWPGVHVVATLHSPLASLYVPPSPHVMHSRFCVGLGAFDSISSAGLHGSRIARHSVDPCSSLYPVTPLHAVQVPALFVLENVPGGQIWPACVHSTVVGAQGKTALLPDPTSLTPPPVAKCGAACDRTRHPQGLLTLPVVFSGGHRDLFFASNTHDDRLA